MCAGMYRLETGRTFADSRIVAQGVVLGSQRKVIAELFVHVTDFYNARRFANAVHSRLSIPGRLCCRVCSCHASHLLSWPCILCHVVKSQQVEYSVEQLTRVSR